MERIVVTGGGGFIGSHLAKYLYERGNFIRVADIKFDDYMSLSAVNSRALSFLSYNCHFPRKRGI